jgi:hypothetical protein
MLEEKIAICEIDRTLHLSESAHCSSDFLCHLVFFITLRELASSTHEKGREEAPEQTEILYSNYSNMGMEDNHVFVRNGQYSLCVG